MYKEIIFILHCFVLSWCFPDPYVFRLTVCFSADPGCHPCSQMDAPLQTQPWALVQLKIPHLKGMVYTRYCADICFIK